MRDPQSTDRINKLAERRPLHSIVVQEEGTIIEGITRREYFAGLAMEGLMREVSKDSEVQMIAKRSVEIAQALCEALDAKGTS